MSSLPHTHEELLQEQAAAKAKKAASTAMAIGSVFKTVFLSTITGSKTTGGKAVVFGSLAGLISFFLPWISLAGTTGWGCARELSGFWLYPASMISCFVLSWFLVDATPHKRIRTARWFIVVGTLWTGPGIAALFNAVSGFAGFGIYAATASVAAILIGGLLQISEQLKCLTAPTPQDS
jgi:hypothetical protein